MWPFVRTRKSRIQTEIQPEEILIDSSNVPAFDQDQFEGRIEQPLSSRSFVAASLCLCVVFAALLARAGTLQIVQGASYAEQAKNNQLEQQIIFADRGMLVDRNNIPLAYNERVSTTSAFAERVYANMRGLAHVVGYVKAPAKDSSGVYFRSEFTGIDGAERAYNIDLGGQNGIQLTETSARGKVVSESVVQPPVAGKKITLSIDANVTQGLYAAIATRADASGFQGGSGVIMDINTGELLAMTSYPEYSQNALESGDVAAFKSINTDKRQPFLNRATNGLYAPGSIVKPVVAAAALTEGIVNENKKILSTGSISLPNPCDPAHPSIFRDWKAHGWVDVRDAIAVSSDVYFYAVGGGFQDQLGLGIEKLDAYFKMFGFSTDAGLAGFTEQEGNIPTPSWKTKHFPSDPTWRIGNTYHTAIGQYGMQVTPLQAVKVAAALANNGKLLTPTLIKDTPVQSKNIPVTPASLQIVREGMRQGVVSGIAQAVKFDYVRVAAKTGTAQIGVHNEFVNSWMIGFFPYERPRYAFAIVLERGPSGTLMGAPAATGSFFSWMHEHAPEYLTEK